MLSKNVFLPRQPGDVGPKDYRHRAKEKAGGVLSSCLNHKYYFYPCFLLSFSPSRRPENKTEALAVIHWC